LREVMTPIVAEEFARCRQSGDRYGVLLYGLLAARLEIRDIGAPYEPFLVSSESLDVTALFGADRDCVQRYFFYDDADGVESFESFRNTYRSDAAWNWEDLGEYAHLTGRGADGRRIDIFANVPIDTHLPKNRAQEGEASRRQQAITAALAARGLIPTVLVHRGHSFWVRHTLPYVASSSRLVILGSCGGATEVHAVIKASHDAEVIATKGIGETAINDSILKAVNDRLLVSDGRMAWKGFWRELESRWGRNALFREYIPPHLDPGTALVRAYYRMLDAER